MSEKTLELSKDYLDYIKKYHLKITHDFLDEEIIASIKSAIYYFKSKISDTFSFEEEFEKEVIGNRVRYSFNNALNEFETDYLDVILTLEDVYAKKETT